MYKVHIQNPYTKSMYTKTIQSPLHIPHIVPTFIRFSQCVYASPTESGDFVYGLNDERCLHYLRSQHCPFSILLLLSGCIFPVFISSKPLLSISEWITNVLIFLNHWHVSGKYLSISFPLTNNCWPVHLRHSKQIICQIACQFVLRTCMFD